MSVLDIAFVLLLVLSLVGGYRRGAVMQVFGLVGSVAGVAAGALAAPHVADAASSRLGRLTLALGVVVVGAAIGNLLGFLLGRRIKARTDPTRFKHVDAVGGAAVSATALVLATWFLGLNLVQGPFPLLAMELRESAVVRALDATLPAPPPLIAELERISSFLGFPDVFAGLPPVPLDAVKPPLPADVRAAAAQARASTPEVLGRGCHEGFLNEGTGFVVAPGYVVTNAHVVAGVTELWIQSGERNYSATVVAFDPRRDIALLDVPRFHAPPLPLAEQTTARGASGAVLGYPAGGPLEASGAAMRGEITATTHDIFGNGRYERDLYELQAAIRGGDSGGPFVLPDGTVAGVVFAKSVVQDGVGYAVPSPDVLPIVQNGVGRTEQVDTGSCVL